MNGQTDPVDKLVPSFDNLSHTYRGTVTGTCLEDAELIFDRYYGEIYSKGMIKEEVFERYNVPVDRTFDGKPYLRNMSIRQENRQRAKVLSSTDQILEHKRLIHNMQMVEYCKKRYCMMQNVKNMR